MLSRLARFDDFHLHGASAPAWNQRYQQISCGAMRSALAELSSDEMHVFRKWMSERVVQQGCLPAGQLCFAVTVGRAAGTPRMQGHEMHSDCLFVLRSGQEFMLQRPAGMQLLALTFEAEHFRRLLDARPWAAPALAKLSRPMLRLPATALQPLRQQLLASLGGAPASAPVVFETLHQLFDDAAESRPAVGSASASFIVEACHGIVAASGDTPPSVDDLCRRLRTSRRSLQNSFRQVADTTPVHYLRSLRLNTVRRRLLHTPAAALSIAQAATDQGFEHLGHLAQRYKTLFGELPSATPRPIATP